MEIQALGYARPLRRLGVRVLPERQGHQPLPARGVGGMGLGRLWQALLAQHARLQAGLGQPAHQGGPRAARELQAVEAVVALLHAIVAPGAAFVCDERCRHVDAGLSPARVKRFADSLEAFLEDDGGGAPDARERENAVVRGALRELWALVEGHKVEWFLERPHALYVLTRHMPTGAEEDDFFVVTCREVDAPARELRFEDLHTAQTFMREKM